MSQSFHLCVWSYQFSLLSIDGVTELQESLKLVVLSEGYNLHHGPKLTKNLKKNKKWLKKKNLIAVNL